MSRLALRHFGMSAAALLFVATGAHAGEGTIEVILNQAKIIKLSRAADTIVVGNPSIADATVKDAKTIVLTGKYFGTTNFVVLDAKGNPIVDQQISVSRSLADTVNIYRQSEVQSYSCTPFCEKLFRSSDEVAAGAAAGAAANQ